LIQADKTKPRGQKLFFEFHDKRPTETTVIRFNLILVKYFQKPLRFPCEPANASQKLWIHLGKTGLIVWKLLCVFDSHRIYRIFNSEKRSRCRLRV